MAASGPAAIQGVMTPDVGGVRLRRHPIELEAVRAMTIARRVGRRLVRWVRAVEDKEENLQRVVGRDPDTGHELREEVLDQEGKPIIVPILPNKDFRDSWDLYERTVRNMLAEQRARAAMRGKGGAPVDDATFDAKLHELARAAVLEMPKDELEELLQLRRFEPNERGKGSGKPGRPRNEPEPIEVAADTSPEQPEPEPSADIFTEFGDEPDA